MEHTISVIFHRNIELIQCASKSVYYFRRQEYECALKHILETIDIITVVVENVIGAGSYFEEGVCSKICDILRDILEAKKNLDFILLADLLQMHLIPLALKIQEMILEKEENVAYSRERYESNQRILYASMAESGIDAKSLKQFSNLLGEPLKTRELIEQGYRIEMTPCGVMTGVVKREQNTFYLHSNHTPLYEAFLLASSWYQKDTHDYNVYGLGLGYHVQELCKIAGEETRITVYESDIDLIKLSCAFTSYLWMKTYPKLSVIFDPELKHFQKVVQEKQEQKQICIHYPSFRNIKEHAAKEQLRDFIPFGLALKNC